MVTPGIHPARSRFAALGALCVTLILSFPPSGSVRADEILIGTGSTNGLYYPLGRAICRLVNRHAEGLRCVALPTDGSVYNLSNVRAGALEFGIVQSDVQYQAVAHRGAYRFVDESYADLRSMFSAHAESFTLVARRDADIHGLGDLPGHRVNIGNPGSGQRATMEVVMGAMGWSKADFTLADQLSAGEQSLALCHGRIQAMVYMVGHPNPSIGRATGLCYAVLVGVTGKAISRLIETSPYYARTTIPGEMYSGNPDSVESFGVLATLVTHADVPAATTYAVIRAVFDHLDSLRRMHPAFATLAPRRMAHDGLSAPLHDGAARYLREHGLQ